MHLEDPQFPPLLKGHAVNSPTRTLAHACRLARSRELGAGDVVWSRNTARAQLAIVLEPEVRLERALQMAPLMLVALGDCIGSLAPPKVAIHYRWPNAILLNGSVAGEVRLAAPRVAPDAVPDWLVVCAELEIASPREERQDWTRTSLSEEAGPEITRTDVLRSLAAHFLTWLNIWQDDGFRPVHDQWLFRAEGREAPVKIAHAAGSAEGRVLGLDECANLLLRPESGEVQSLSFLDCVDLIDERPRAP
jgi:BirA family transcriptional regulator, biotin operon repressor / biotin---[acetyl-CoA-carboxylase] ligase